MISNTIDDIKNFLSENSIKPSIQRVKIYQFLLNNKIHPTADEIYKRLNSELITLSKTTVYNTLHLFVDKGVVQPIHIEGNEVRYDADFSQHTHFKCNDCGMLYDLHLNLNIQGILELKKFEVKDIQVLISGICDKCVSGNPIN
ncbi:MAG: Ferric-uptake regulator [Clostridiales bacterium 38_11]|nr:MAG: Ferric-uptake regulator [Clostridiales bacterium 38_11]HBH13264.1 transcriptional repressor [Clostridiales bacterium]